MKTWKNFFVGLVAVLGGVAVAATFNQFSPATGVLKGNASTFVTTAAVSSDIRAMWSGTCDATTFLRGDGACSAAVTAPAGADTQVQFNNGGAFGADSDFTWNSTTNGLTLSNITLNSATGSVFGSATGGAQGAGTINATQVYVNGVPVGTGSGSVTSVGLAAPAIFTVSGSPVTTSGTLTLTASGTSGGVPYFDSATTMASSGALTANRLVLGGGAGAAPTVLGSLGTTTTVLHGNAGGAPTFGAVSLTADVTGTLPFGNGGTGLSSAADDTTLISSGSAWVATAVPNCTDTSGNHLNYATASNSFTCGTSAPGGFTGFANPTASLGLTAVNGVATTAMRSDAAPALSQSITPTWSGLHTFTAGSGGGFSGATIALSGTLPYLAFNDTGASANGRLFRMFNSGNTLTIDAATDNGSTARTIFAALRGASSAAVSNIAFGNSTDNPSYSFTGSGTAAFSGNVTVGGSSVCRQDGTNCPVAKVAWARVQSTGTITDSSGVSSVTKGTTGKYTLNFSSAFSTGPACTCSVQQSATTGYDCHNDAGAGQIVISANSAGTFSVSDQAFHVICTGT